MKRAHRANRTAKVTITMTQAEATALREAAQPNVDQPARLVDLFEDRRARDRCRRAFRKLAKAIDRAA